MSAIDELLANNERFAERFVYEGLGAAPRRGVAIVACKDARIAIERVLGLEPGDAHVIRNAGGVVTEDVLRSLTVSQRMLHTREVMLIGHTECGMMTFDDDEAAASVERETGESLPFRLRAFRDLRARLRESLELVRSARFLPHRDRVRSFIYDVRTGRLSELDDPAP